MDLKSLLTGKDEKPNELYWAVVLEPGWVQAGIWEIDGEVAKVISISPATHWETEEDLVTSTDTALSAAIQTLPESLTEPTKTVFGVQSSWVEGGQIKEQYLDRIKVICSDLSLTPVGFVVVPEAIAHLTKSEEGSPLNAIVMGVSGENIELALFNLGTLSGNTTVARSVSLYDDLIEGLTRFTSVNALPSRILLYDGKEGELEDERQELTQANWDATEKVKFLHTPKIEIVTPERKLFATALAGGSEIASVTKVQAFMRSSTGEEGISPEQSADLENIQVPEKPVGVEDLGFVVGQDVAQAQQPAIAPRPTQTPVPVQGVPQKFVPGNILSAIKSKLSFIKLPSFSQKPSVKMNVAHGKNTFFLGLGILVVVLIVGFIAWWLLPKATVTIYVSPKELEENTQVIIDKNVGSVDLAALSIPGEWVDTKVSGEKTKTTTGTKVVGDKAKGAVKIENGLPTPINLPAGTVVLSASNLKFVTVSAASVSAALSPGTPGTTSVEITAGDIGAEYNLAKDEVFKVSNYVKAEVDAISTDNFSGGSSRQIAVVAKEDQETLEEDLTKELLSQAKDTLIAGLSEDMYFVSESVSGTPDKKTFSGKAGDEGANLKLSLDLSVTGIAIKKSQLFDLVKNVLQEKVPSGLVLKEDQIRFVFELTKGEENKSEFALTVTANLLPQINPDEIAKKIAGRYPDMAEKYLNTITGFVNAEIRLLPPLPGKLGTLPHLAKNITIEVASER